MATTVKVTDSLVLLVLSSKLLALLENEVIFGATVSVLLILTTRSWVDVLPVLSVAANVIVSVKLPKLYEAYE